MIDLHLHTTASDGRLASDELVARAAAAGLRIIAVTDHDTTAAIAGARASAARAGLELVDGVEVTSVYDGRDVHILGYFIDPDDVAFNEFLGAQRARRVDRVREIGRRLNALDMPVDVEDLLTTAATRPGASVGRPAIAQALVRQGHVASTSEAFERFLAAGRPAFVPRSGPSPQEVVRIIHEARGLASMAHPAVTNKPEVMAALVHEGLDAIEVFHSDHSPEIQHELKAFADAHHLLATGGSDFHGDESRDRPLGRTTLPVDAFERLRDAARRHGVTGAR